MLNLKKGLALVLAAATAFTFAPISTSFAASRTWDDDGLTKSNKIDSIADLSEFTLTTTDSSKTLQLAEHNDLSNSGIPVKGYRITIQRGRGNTEATKNNYYSVIKAKTPASGETGYNKIKKEDNSTTNATVTGDTSWGTQDPSISSESWIVQNVSGYPAQTSYSGSSALMYQINGAWVKFDLDTTELAKTNQSDFTVKVEALKAFEQGAASAGDVSTFTIHVKRGSLTTELNQVYKINADGSKTVYTKDSDGVYNIPEGTSVIVTYRVVDYNKSTNSKQQVSVDRRGNANGAVVVTNKTGTIDQSSANNVLSQNASDPTHILLGRATFTTGAKGTSIVALKADAVDNSDGALTLLSLDINTVAGNGKLYVTYDTQSSGTQTFEDNYEDQSNTANGVHFVTSDSTHAVANGSLQVGTRKNTNWTTTGAAAKDGYDWNFESRAVLPAAKTVYNADGSKTVQISASATVGADVTYALVAPSTLYDANTGNASTANTDKTAKTYNFNPTTGKFDGKLDGFSNVGIAGQSNLLSINANNTNTLWNNVDGLGVAGAGDAVTFTQEAARTYGAIDNTGLVTLKDGSNKVPLFVVVTAAPQSQDDTTGTVERCTSTYVIPVNVVANQPLQFYVGNAGGYASQYYKDITKAENATVPNTLYLSDEKKSDTIEYYSNAGDNYITARVTDTKGIFSYNASTKTISVDTAKAGTSAKTTLIVSTSSAPDIEGTINVTINVEYKKSLHKDGALTLAQDTVVRKGGNSARKQINATAVTPENADVIYDRTLYVYDASYPTKYRPLRSDESGFGDVIMTSSGWVTYSKNAGTVYVRAHAEKSGYIPSGYAYAPVQYGAAALKTDNKITVDQKSIVIKAGETATVKASAKTALSVVSADNSVATAKTDATVATASAITVTGVKAGKTTVTVTAAEDAAKGIDSATLEIPVVVTDENGNSDAVTKPAKVTGLKVKNKKGAKVSVTWKAQDKSVLYRVYKKVGNGSWKAKNVTNAKATLDVKKGAKVTVKVKAFRRDANGKAVWQSGKATKAKAFKTDKK